jgi:pyridoxine 5'-phosphate synthase PdxJ
MTRITIDLEPLAGLYQDGAEMVKSLVKNALACEIGGADSVVIGIGKETDQKRKRVVSLLIESLDISLSVKAGLDERTLEILQELKPGMVILPYQPDKREVLASTITNFQIENILVGLEIPLELEQVKEAAKLKCDYAILNSASYCSAKTVNARIDELNKIVKIAGLCNRLSVGVIAAGNFGINQLSRLNSAVQIEEYILGLPFYSSSLIYGYAKAIEGIRFAVS